MYVERVEGQAVDEKDAQSVSPALSEGLPLASPHFHTSQSPWRGDLASSVSWTPWGVSCPLDSFLRRLRVERDKTVSAGPAQKEIAPANGLGLGGRSGSNFKI